MDCIICNNNLGKKYFIGKKSGMKIYFCKEHKRLCDNDCVNYECVDGFCKKVNKNKTKFLKVADS